MTPRFLLDTHVVVRWLSQPKKLSQDQRRVVGDAVHRCESLGVSGVTLLEIAVRFSDPKTRVGDPPEELLAEIDANPAFYILPITTEIAAEVVALRKQPLRSNDCAIVATARNHGLTLLTSDQPIIASKLVPVVE